MADIIAKPLISQSLIWFLEELPKTELASNLSKKLNGVQ